jgi:hypothetical protein
VAGKRKVCESRARRSHPLHSFSTSTKTVQRLLKYGSLQRISQKICIDKKFASRHETKVPEENSLRREKNLRPLIGVAG